MQLHTFSPSPCHSVHGHTAILIHLFLMEGLFCWPTEACLGEVVWQACELLLIVLYLLFHFPHFYCFSRRIPAAFSDRGACWEMRTRCVVRCEEGEGVSIVHCVVTEQGPGDLCPPGLEALLFSTTRSSTSPRRLLHRFPYHETPQSHSTTWEHISYRDVFLHFEFDFV